MIFWLVLKLEINYRIIVSVFFFPENFRKVVTKKKRAGESNKGILKIFLKKKSPYLDQKNLELAKLDSVILDVARIGRTVVKKTLGASKAPCFFL